MGYKVKPNFYAVIPASVRYSDLPANAKLLYGEITALSSREGYCWASNDYFAELYGVEERTIQRWIEALVEKGFLLRDTVDNKRILVIAEGVTKMSWGGDKNVTHNNTSNNINNITNVIDESPKDDSSKPKKETYGRPEINELFKYWEDQIGIPITTNVQKNRNFCNILLKKQGIENMRKLIRTAAKASESEFAPRIADFIELHYKLHKLLMWAKTANDPQKAQKTPTEALNALKTKPRAMLPPEQRAKNLAKLADMKRLVSG